MALFPDPFDTLLGLQQALDAFQRSSWLQSGPSSSGTYPPCNVDDLGFDLQLTITSPGPTLAANLRNGLIKGRDDRAANAFKGRIVIAHGMTWFRATGRRA